jgi:hypothetical protein
MSLRLFFARAARSRLLTASPPAWVGALVVVAAFALAHGPHVVRNLEKWHWEDGRHFHHNRQQVHSIADCFLVPSAWAGGAEATYRPLSANLYYFAGRVLFGNRIEAFHALDALAHAANGVLLFLLCRSLLPGALALLPPVLFVTRQAHAQDFVYTSNFDTLSYSGLTLLALLLFVIARRRERPRLEAAAMACFVLALLCKEAAVVWPAILTAYGWLFDRARAWGRYAAAWVVTAVWVAGYRQMIRILYPGGTPGFGFDLTPRGVLGRFAAYLLSFLNGLVPRIDPEKAGWAIPPHLTAIAARGPMVALMAGLVVIEIVLLVAARTHPDLVGPSARVTALGLFWFFAGTAPFVVLADRLFMRYSYFGHAGLALAVGGLAAGLARRYRPGRPPQGASSAPPGSRY